MRASESKAAVGGFVAVLLLLLGNTGVSYWTTTRLVENDRWVMHSREVLEALDAVRAAIAEAEANQRGYLIKDQPSYLDAYETAAAEARSEFAELLSLTADNPPQQARAAKLQTLVSNRL
jgi:CHASE3 domain sensor protein